MTPRVFPVLGLGVSLALLGHLVTQQDAQVFLLVGAVLVVGAALWLADRLFWAGDRAAPEAAG